MAAGEPLCDGSFPLSMATMDHLKAVRQRDRIDYRAESALEEVLNALIVDNTDRSSVTSDQVVGYLNRALRNVSLKFGRKNNKSSNLTRPYEQFVYFDCFRCDE